MSEIGRVPKILLSEQESRAAVVKQAIKPETEISPTVLAEFSEKARIAGDSSKADYLLLLAWAAYDEIEKLQTDIGPCSSRGW